MSRYLRMFIALTSVGACMLVYVGSSFATEPALTGQAVQPTKTKAAYDLIPGGLAKTNAKSAWSQFNSRAFLDPELRRLMASESAVTSYNPNDYVVVGYGKASPGTTNTQVLAGGKLAPNRDTARCHIGAKVMIVVHKTTQKRMEICTACGNPRLNRVVQQLPKRDFALGTQLRFDKHVSKPFKIVCPSGQKVTGRLNVWVNGLARGRTWGELQGQMKAQLRLKLDLAVKAKVKLKCGQSPKPKPVPPVQGSQVVCRLHGVPQYTQPGGYVIDTAGNCVAQTNNAEQDCKAVGGSWSGNTQLCTIIQINANCSNITVVNGSGNVVSTTQQGNCNAGTPPPVTPPVIVVPPPPPPPALCEPAADRNQYNKCVPPCPPTEKRFTRGSGSAGYGWVDSGQTGLQWSVWYNTYGNGFWGQSNQIPSGAVSGQAACYKPAPPSGGGSGGPPPSP